MLDISITLVVIAHVVVSLLLILVILMQRPKQEGLGASFGSGVTDAAWGARTTDVLQKGTVYLGTLFFVFSLVLAILMGKRNSIEGKNYASDGGSTANAPLEKQNPQKDILATEPPVGTIPVKPEGATPEGATPEGATPEGATPEGTTPEGTTPEGTTPEGATPEGATPEGTTPEGTTPEGTTPEETTPEETAPEGTTPEGE